VEDPFDDLDNGGNNSTSTTRRRTFPYLLSDFLYSRQGSKYKKNFHFKTNLTCNSPAPPITATQFSITYLPFSGPEEHIPGRKAVTDLIEKANISSHTFSFSKVYAAWETDEVIGFELWRNLGLAMISVFVITLILLANIQICLMVLLCVALTLVDMVGMLHFWGITVDTLSCINIVLAIGLCVDYSAHIAHAFIVSQGTREERAVNSLTSMGPAIINGGVTTFLALILLGFSQSHVFITFFKVFTLTVAFGLFHGVVFFPVILSIVGPSQQSHLASTSTSVTSVDSVENGKVVKAAKSNGLPNLAFVIDNNAAGQRSSEVNANRKSAESAANKIIPSRNLVVLQL
jgi:Niemann-Pick C1 protein